MVETDDKTPLTVYETFFRGTDLKPDKKLRNYDDEEIIFQLEIVQLNKNRTLLQKGIGKRSKQVTI